MKKSKFTIAMGQDFLACVGVPSTKENAERLKKAVKSRVLNLVYESKPAKGVKK